MHQNIKRLILLMHCPDQKGIIAAVTNFINSRNGNITYIDQYVDRLHGAFFMRISIESMNNSIDFNTFKGDFAKKFSSSLNLKCNFYQEDKLPKLGVFVSKYDHCLYDILTQQRSGKLKCEIPFILSNHVDLEYIATQFDIPF
jgi:formyltetrahydrofolate deformylase